MGDDYDILYDLEGGYDFYNCEQSTASIIMPLIKLKEKNQVSFQTIAQSIGCDPLMLFGIKTCPDSELVPLKNKVRHVSRLRVNWDSQAFKE
jgi:hypothetical protein